MVIQVHLIGRYKMELIYTDFYVLSFYNYGICIVKFNNLPRFWQLDVSFEFGALWKFYNFNINNNKNTIMAVLRSNISLWSNVS